jgi:hypothetical protein
MVFKPSSAADRPLKAFERNSISKSPRFNNALLKSRIISLITLMVHVCRIACFVFSGISQGLTDCIFTFFLLHKSISRDINEIIREKFQSKSIRAKYVYIEKEIQIYKSYRLISGFKYISILLRFNFFHNNFSIRARSNV